ncbi:MAG: hypothetical protein PQJ59_10675 [Spirochaetales bacterium]|nr:hypothetical protein [Spirochaetales bacterium]
MKKNKTTAHIGLLLTLLLWLFFSCSTVPVNTGQAYYLPADGERVLYLAGAEADRFLRPMADSLGVEDYGKIEPILEETDRFYLVSRGDALFIQGQGDYNTGFINFVLGANRGWEKEKIGPFKTYRSESTSLQLAFPDGKTFLMSQGHLEEILDAYFAGGSQDYPFSSDLEGKEALLVRLDLEGEGALSLQSVLNMPLRTALIALSPAQGETLLMDVELVGEEQSGRLMGTALKLFLLASVGRDAMKAALETGNDYARVTDVPVDLDFLMNMIGI